MFINFFKRGIGRHHEAFTLVELLVVISIVGMLSSVVFAGVTTARVKGKDASRVQTVAQIRNALELYYSDNKVYPPVPVSGKIEDMVTASLMNYVKTLPSNFSVVGHTTEYILNSSGGYQLLMTTEAGGAFAKNNGCDDSIYSAYNDSNDSKAYCLGSKQGSGTTIRAINLTTSSSGIRDSNGRFGFTWSATNASYCKINSSNPAGILPVGQNLPIVGTLYANTGGLPDYFVFFQCFSATPGLDLPQITIYVD